jgi:raffinose/stachyose/melibiose transport system permease protein
MRRRQHIAASDIPGRIVYYAAAIVVTILLLLPLVWVFVISFKTKAEIYGSSLSIPTFRNIANYKEAFRTVNFLRVFANTAFLAAVSVSLEVILSFTSSYAIARFRLGRGRTQNLLYNYFVSGLMIPVFILIFPIYQITQKLGLTGSYLALILPYLAMGLSFNTLLFVGSLKGIPMELEEAAIIDGCNVFQMIFRIVLPLVVPVLATVIVFNALGIWNEFPLASVLISQESMKTIALSVSKFKGTYSTDTASIAAFVVIMILPELAFYAFFQKYIIAGMTAGAVKG